MKLNCNKFLLGFIYGIKIFKKQKKLPIRQLSYNIYFDDSKSIILNRNL